MVISEWTSINGLSNLQMLLRKARHQPSPPRELSENYLEIIQDLVDALEEFNRHSAHPDTPMVRIPLD